ncbi:hypothetical protein BGX31_003083 [Mortierella sp. GBA43]|nr:hypothetical protein BGX31_003083 [Mortierella sp. GBA43]
MHIAVALTKRLKKARQIILHPNSTSLHQAGLAMNSPHATIVEVIGIPYVLKNVSNLFKPASVSLGLSSDIKSLVRAHLTLRFGCTTYDDGANFSTELQHRLEREPWRQITEGSLPATSSPTPSSVSGAGGLTTVTAPVPSSSSSSSSVTPVTQSTQPAPSSNYKQPVDSLVLAKQRLLRNCATNLLIEKQVYNRTQLSAPSSIVSSEGNTKPKKAKRGRPSKKDITEKEKGAKETEEVKEAVEMKEDSQGESE